MPKGLKRVARKLANGSIRVHWYHRATNTALDHDPESAEGIAEVARLDGKAKKVVAASEHPEGTYARLWTAYTDRENPSWTSLKPRTRSDYQKVRDWLGPAAERMILVKVTQQDINRLRAKAAAAKGRRFGNYVVQVIRLTYTWAIAHGHAGVTVNPVEKVKLTRKPKSEKKVNRAWQAFEVEAFMTDCPFQLLVPFALGLFAGMREGDAIRVTRRAYAHNRQVIEWIAGKNGEDCTASVEGVFKAILDEALVRAKAQKHKAVQLALNSYGDPWTESGFRASFFKRLRALRAAGAVKPGCTFHGLRHTIGTFARNDGESDSRVAAAIGDRSTAMAGIYGRDADRVAAQIAVLAGVQKRFENIEWKRSAK